MNFNVREESHKTPDQLEREIDMRREHIVDTLDELGHRLSPRHVVDQTVDYVRDNAGVFSRNLSSTVTRNPGPILLTAAGLLWMFSSLRNRRHADASSRAGLYYPDSYADQDYYGEYDYEIFDEYADPAALDVDESIGGSSASSGSGFSSSGSGFSSGYGTNPSTGINSGNGTVGEKSRKEQLKDKAKDTKRSLTDAANEARHKFDSAKAKARQKAAQMRHGSARDAVRDQSRRVADEFEHMVERHPIIIGAAGVALGALVAASFAPTRTEDRLMGSTRDAVKDRASAKAKQAGEKAEAKARETGAKVQEDIKQKIRPDSGSSPYTR